MEKHIQLLGILFIIFAAIGIFAAFIILTILIFSGVVSGDEEALFITSIVGIILGGFIIFLSIPGLFVGYGLIRRKEWGRILAIILGFLNLINFPFGTALGAYALWVLLNQDTIQEF